LTEPVLRCQYCGSLLKENREKAPVQDTGSKEEIIEAQIQQELREMDKPPEPTSQAVNVFCFIIGAVVAFFSITNIIENFEIYSAMLILTGPVALIFLIIPLKNWFPRLKGVIYIVAGLVLAATYVIVSWRILENVLVQVGIAVIIGLIMIIYGITELEPVKRKRKAKLQKMVKQFNDRRS
jgi:hypothetical protein